MPDWKALWPNEVVQLRRGYDILASGPIDEITSDGTAMWIYFPGVGRKLIHHEDGVAVYRIDPRILRDRHTLSPNRPKT